MLNICVLQRLCRFFEIKKSFVVFFFILLMGDMNEWGKFCIKTQYRLPPAHSALTLQSWEGI